MWVQKSESHNMLRKIDINRNIQVVELSFYWAMMFISFLKYIELVITSLLKTATDVPWDIYLIDAVC